MTTKKSAYRPIVKWDVYYHRWNVSSETYDNHQYAVKVMIVEQCLKCNCAYGRSLLRSKNKSCKHIKAVEDWLEQQPVNERVDYR